MTIIHRLPGALVGPEVANLPTLSALMLPSVGVSSYGYRWRAESLDQGIGTDVTSWATVAGLNPLTVPASRTAPKLRASGARRYVEFDGVNNVLQSAATSLTGQRTIAIVAKTTGAGGTQQDLFSMADNIRPGISRNSAGNTALFTPGSASRQYAGDLSTWTFVAATFQLSDAILYYGANATPSVATGVTGDALTSLRLALLNGTAPGAVQIAEVVTWPGVLTPTQIGQVRTALTTAQAGLL